MADVSQQLMQELNIPKIGIFYPHVYYHEEIDTLFYIWADCAYRTEFVDNFLAVLWEPYTNMPAPIGISIYYFQFLLERIDMSFNSITDFGLQGI